MRLYPDHPEILTPGRWHWCADGAQAIPFMHAFGAHQLPEPDQDGEPPIGETNAYGGFSAGRANPRFTGQHFCGAQQLWQNGSPIDLMGTPPVQADGVPVCCDAPGQPAGGLVLDGDSTFTNANTVFFWVRPEEIADQPDGTPLATWPGAPGSHADLVQAAGSPLPIKFTDPDTGSPMADFRQQLIPTPTLGPVLVAQPPLPALPSCSLYLVTTQSSLDHHMGPEVIGPTTHAAGVFLAGDGLITFATTAGAAVVPFSGLEGQRHVFGCRVSPSLGCVSVDGVPILGPGGPGGGTLTLGGLTTTTHLVHDQGTVFVFELLLFDRYLSDDEDCEVQAYLCAKYQLPVQECKDVLPGTILAWGGAAVPSGYLACDGSAVSRSDFALLFAALGTTWGAGDGSTTFGLPDLRGRAVIGSGTGGGLSPRVLAAIGGEETHTLDTAEMPAHSHALTDPEHFHTITDPQSNFAAGAPQPQHSAGASHDADGTGFVTDPAATGLTIDSTGGGGAHNNMQPFGVVQWIVKA